MCCSPKPSGPAPSGTERSRPAPAADVRRSRGSSRRPARAARPARGPGTGGGSRAGLAKAPERGVRSTRLPSVSELDRLRDFRAPRCAAAAIEHRSEIVPRQGKTFADLAFLAGSSPRRSTESNLAATPQSLLEDFPGIAGVLGQSAWERLVEEYLLAHPPTSFSLRDLGEKLPAFLESADFLPQRELVLDMARFEWAHIEVFDAPAVPPLTPEAVADLDEEALASARLVLSPALRLLGVSYPVRSCGTAYFPPVTRAWRCRFPSRAPPGSCCIGASCRSFIAGCDARPCVARRLGSRCESGQRLRNRVRAGRRRGRECRA